MNSRIAVFGTNLFLDQLVADVLAREPGWFCSVGTDIEEMLASLESIRSEPRWIVMVDNGDISAKEALFRHLSADRGKPPFIAALFNVDPNQVQIFRAVQRGIRGVFYLNDPLEQLTAGMRALMSGQVWVRRNVLLEAATNKNGGEREEAPVTRREEEILILLGMGVTNEEIADRLFISTHTVKTHLYNIYQKLGVRNRFHAALWAAQNINGAEHVASAAS